MRTFFSKRLIFTSLIFIVAVTLAVFFTVFKDDTEESVVETPIVHLFSNSVIGHSVNGRDIDAYTYTPSRDIEGAPKEHILFVGGIHGGYEWNSVVLAYEFIDYLEANLSVIPLNITVTVIPSANPDGVYKVVGKEGRFTVADVPDDVATAPGRFNANEVDLNRNFDCKWQPESKWRDAVVSAGTSPFSESESKVIRDFVLKNRPNSVIFWHSQSGSVYASECEEGILPETLDIMNVYANASGYSPVSSFDAYPTTGDAEGWLASIGIPALTVELTTHKSIELGKNIKGVKALFEYYK